MIKEREKTEALELKVAQVRKQLVLEKLLKNKRTEEHKRREALIQEALFQACLKFAYRCFTFFDEPPPLAWAVKIKDTVREILNDKIISSDLDKVKLALEKEINLLREQYNREILYPKLKNELIKSAIESLHFSIYDSREFDESIKARVREILEEKLTGEEFPEEVYALAEDLKEKVERELRQSLYSRKEEKH